MVTKNLCDKTPEYKSYYQRNKEKCRLKGRLHYAATAEYQKDLRQYRRKQILDHYGPLCACCGEKDDLFLSIDHVNNDGYKERKTKGGQSDNMCQKIIKNGFPNTYQILCFNCNLGKARNGGICPHLTKKNNE